jgi:glutaredoxin-related protein
MVFSKSGKKGVYPLLFVDDEFVGDHDMVVNLNEEELLSSKLKAN